MITARTLATRIRIVLKVGIALARVRRAGFGRFTCANSLTVPASLGTTATFTLLAGPIATVRPSPPPKIGSGTAGRTAVTTKRMKRPEGLFTTFQQTKATPQSTRADLQRPRFLTTLRWGHGESLLPDGSSLVAKRQLRGEALSSNAAIPCTATDSPD